MKLITMGWDNILEKDTPMSSTIQGFLINGFFLKEHVI